jgi:hypothetical protein
MRVYRSLGTAGVLMLAIAMPGCGGSSGSSSKLPSPTAKEHNPAGDIPDNQVYVSYRPPGAGFTIKVPEGWAQRSATGTGTVTFTDNLNSIAMQTRPAKAAPTVASVKSTLLPQLRRGTPGFSGGTVSGVSRPAGKAVRIVYSAASRPDPVTGKRKVDAVERYLFFHKGKLAVLTLSGPKGADNVDPWKLVTSSLRWTP